MTDPVVWWLSGSKRPSELQAPGMLSGTLRSTKFRLQKRWQTTWGLVYTKCNILSCKIFWLGEFYCNQTTFGQKIIRKMQTVLLITINLIRSPDSLLSPTGRKEACCRISMSHSQTLYSATELHFSYTKHLFVFTFSIADEIGDVGSISQVSMPNFVSVMHLWRKWSGI